MNPIDLRERYEDEQVLVACKGPDGAYYLATREVFTSRVSAQEYADTISPELTPILVSAVRPIMAFIRS